MKLYQALSLIRGLKRGDLLSFSDGRVASVVEDEPLKEAKSNGEAILLVSEDKATERLPVLALKDMLVAGTVEHASAVVARVVDKAKKQRVYRSRTRKQFAEIIDYLSKNKPVESSQPVKYILKEFPRVIEPANHS